MFSLWALTSCSGVTLLHPNWGKFKSFVTSWKEPEPAAQAHAELSGLPTSHRPGPAWVLPATEPPTGAGPQQSQAAQRQPPWTHSDRAAPPRAAWPACPVNPGEGGLLFLHEGWLWPHRQPWPRANRTQEAGRAAEPLRPAGVLGTLQGMNRGQTCATLAGRSHLTLLRGQKESTCQEPTAAQGQMERPSCLSSCEHHTLHHPRLFLHQRAPRPCPEPP